MTPKITMRQTLEDPALLGNVLKGDTWRPWWIVLIALMGELLEPDELDIYQRVTGGRKHPSGKMVAELLAIIGRRGGKSRAIAVLASYIGCLCEHPNLVRGEPGVVLCIAPDQRQAGVVLGYIRAIIEDTPILAKLLADGQTQDSVRLNNGIVIQVRAASFRRLRGITCVACICDEAAFFYTDEGSANADTEILAAMRPTLATTGGPLIIITSPHARRGEVWEIFRAHYGPDGSDDILVVKGTSTEFNPSLDQAVIERALAKDEAAARAEYMAEFRSDIEAFVTREVVEGCVSFGVRERPHVSGVSYKAFCDPAGGSGGDEMTLCIAHGEGERVVIDAVRGRKPPFSPDNVVTEFCSLLTSYGISEVTGDRWGGEFCHEPFRKQGINFKLAEKVRSELYRDALLPRLNSGTVDLLDDKRTIDQIVGLERRVARGGRETIDHGPGKSCHDDRANVVAGAVSLVVRPVVEQPTAACGTYGRVGDDPWSQRRAAQHPYVGVSGRIGNSVAVSDDWESEGGHQIGW